MKEKRKKSQINRTKTCASTVRTRKYTVYAFSVEETLYICYDADSSINEIYHLI